MSWRHRYHTTERTWLAWLYVLVIFAAVACCWIQAVNESATYNRLTGAHTTAWDALWCELRVQGEIQR